MGSKRVVWHVGFERILRQFGPRSFEVRSEVQLSAEPLRIDYLLLRKILPPGDALDDSARTLRGLWPLLPRVSVVEYKSRSHTYRPGNLDRLWGYIHTYFASERSLPRSRADGTVLLQGTLGAPEVGERPDLCAVLVVPARTPSLDQDATSMGLTWNELGGGYWKLTGGLFVLLVVELDIAGPSEGDALLHYMGHGTMNTPEVRRFWAELVSTKSTKEAGMRMQDMEGYDELMQEMLATLSPEQRLAGLAPEQRLAGLAPEQRRAGLPPEQWLAGLAPEQRLAGLAPEQRLAGLAPEQRLAGLAPEQWLAGADRDHQALALPVEVLRLLPDTYFRSLSPDVQVEIRRRLAHNDH